MSTTGHPAPYLSIVATARNDNHGGDLLRRMQIFVDGLAEQCRRFALPAELVLVEWNPPADRPRLIDALRWPEEPGPLVVRIVEVPAEVHGRFWFADRLPLFQMLAKNVGIRRARGAFILATNVDLLFSHELMRNLARRQLRPGYMYRVDRYDSEADVPLEASLDEQLAYCQDHLLRINRREGTLDYSSGEWLTRIYWEPTWRVRLLERLQDWRLIPAVTRPRLHVNGCGDFTLMAKAHWWAIRGYPELQMHSMHLDWVLCLMAHFGGAREHFLRPPACIYHLEHGGGWSPEGETALNQRLAEKGIDQLDIQQVHRWAIQMRQQREPIIFSDEQWGLAGEALPETQVACAGAKIA